ncbi:MAG: Phage integrase family protein, partial [Planctomycetaceae bacterium]|nr:Phage integrase family protein [Planctomycetaceae bacterium]
MPPKKAASIQSEKPYPEFPLTANRRNNQWCKKIRGRVVYFGSLEDHAAALEKYLLEVDEWQAGRNPREKVNSDSVSMEELCNHFLEEKAGKVTSREITSRTHFDYNRTSQRLCDFLGKTRPTSSLNDETFKKIRSHFTQTEAGKPAGLVTIMNHMRRLRTLFYFALSKKWLKGFTERDLRKLLEIPSKKSRRIERNSK